VNAFDSLQVRIITFRLVEIFLTSEVGSNCQKTLACSNNTLFMVLFSTQTKNLIVYLTSEK
jgi:hypothetical protein